MKNEHFDFVVEHLKLRDYIFPTSHPLDFYIIDELKVESSRQCIDIVRNKGSTITGLLFSRLPNEKFAEEVILFIKQTEVLFI
mgnify:FL=1